MQKNWVIFFALKKLIKALSHQIVEQIAEAVHLQMAVIKNVGERRERKLGIWKIQVN